MFKKFFAGTKAEHLALAMSVLLDPTSRANAHGLLRVEQMR